MRAKKKSKLQINHYTNLRKKTCRNNTTVPLNILKIMQFVNQNVIHFPQISTMQTSCLHLKNIFHFFPQIT